jgi:hypothetical protein
MPSSSDADWWRPGGIRAATAEEHQVGRRPPLPCAPAFLRSAGLQRWCRRADPFAIGAGSAARLRMIVDSIHQEWGACRLGTPLVL